MAISRTLPYLSLLTTVALASTLITAPAAQAGPDDGKALGTQKHIDAPKAYWSGDNFELQALEDTQLDDAVLWVGKGSNLRGIPQYMFTLPEDNSLAHIGQPGQVFYNAPYNPGAPHHPIWWGYGADTDLPLEQFRGGVASMDLIAVEGPGEVEMFNHRNRRNDPELLFGTSPNSPKSAKLRKGLHTHNNTLFTKPGRYVLTYRSTARDLDGNLIASQPQKLAVQVGGQAPKPEATPSLQQRFDAAASGDTTGYTLSLAPSDTDLHTNIEFAAPGAGDGTLTVLIDGYFLTDLEVNDGTAEWEEFLGPLDSEIQAVFTPAEGQPGARWISEPLGYELGAQNQTSTSAADWTDNTGTERRLQNTEEVHLDSGEIKVRLEPAENQLMKLIVEGDENLSGFITGGVYSQPEDENAAHAVDAAFHGGRAEVVVLNSDWMKNHTARFTIDAHPTVDAGSTTLTLTESLSQDFAPIEMTATLSDLSPAPTRQARTCGERLVLDHGHVDILARHNDEMTVVLKDDTGIHSAGSVERDLDEVVLEVDDAARVVGEQESLEFLGDSFYLLPQAQNPDLIWPGYNTQALDYSRYQDGVDLRLEPRSIPDDAQWALFTTSAVGDIDIQANSTTEDHV